MSQHIDLEWQMRIADRLIEDARHMAFYGSREEREELLSWVLGDKAPFPFETACDLLHKSEEQTRNEIVGRMMKRAKVEKELGI